VYIHDSPYNTQKSLQDVTDFKQKTFGHASNSIFLVFPDASPFIYVSIAASPGQASGSESRSLRKVVLDAVPKALSRPQCHYVLKTTSLMTKSLHALLALRGGGRTNAASGGWSIFAEDSFGHDALDYSRPSAMEKESVSSSEMGRENLQPDSKRSNGDMAKTRADSPTRKRRKLVAQGRFGCSGLEGDGEGIERFDVRIDDPFPITSDFVGSTVRRNDAQAVETPMQQGEVAADRRGRKSRPSLLDRVESDEEDGSQAESSEWKPDVRFSFQGSHVFAGIRQLVEQGVFDGERMPGWMTGEAGVSVGVVRHGRMMIKRNAEC